MERKTIKAEFKPIETHINHMPKEQRKELAARIVKFVDKDKKSFDWLGERFNMMPGKIELLYKEGKKHGRKKVQ